MRFGDRYSLPSSTGAMLGSSFHAVMKLGNRGELPQGAAGLQMAKGEFDKEAQGLFAHAHPLIKAKYATLLKIPYYSIRRSRAAVLALRASAAAGTRAANGGVYIKTGGRDASRLVDQSLKSQDRTVTGTLDLLEPTLSKISDYKTGEVPLNNPSGMSASEVRQLRLYAYLAKENDQPVAEASIIRGDGDEVTIPITPESAAAEAASAKEMLREFNRSVAAGKSFRDIATPSPDCDHCPCIPFCERFWEEATPEWEEACGTHAEGMITAIRDANVAGTKLKTLTLDLIAEPLLEGDSSRNKFLSIGCPSVRAFLTVGSTVRIVLAARSGLEPEHRTLHVDRFKATTIWHVLPPPSP